MTGDSVNAPKLCVANSVTACVGIHGQYERPETARARGEFDERLTQLSRQRNSSLELPLEPRHLAALAGRHIQANSTGCARLPPNRPNPVRKNARSSPRTGFEMSRMLGTLGSKNVNLCLQALPQGQVMGADFEPGSRLLEKIQASANLYDPSVIEPNLSVMQVWIDFYLKFDI